MDVPGELVVGRADRVLLWLKILTIFIGGVATIVVVFLADVMMSRLANPTGGVAGVEAVTMSEVEELHHWLGYKLAVAAQDDKDVVYHVAKIFALAKDAKQKSALDGILVEHMPSGHFIHTKNILKDLLGTKPAPPLSTMQLEAKLALVLIKENKIGDAQEQGAHLVAVTTGPAKETAQQALEALQGSDLETAQRLLAELSGAP